MDELLTEFLIETAEGLAEADRALLRLERAPADKETLAIIFRAVHTIKGSCGFLPLPRLGAIAHAAEEVLVRVRDGSLEADPALISAVLAALDRIKLITNALASTGHEVAGDDADLKDVLGGLLAGVPAETIAPPKLDLGREDMAAPQQAVQTIRVGVGVIETLMTLVSELVLTRNQLIQIARGQDDSRFTAALQRLSHLTSDLQEGVMKTRMQPIGHLTPTLTRLVRDLARDLGKRIELTVSGGQTELDRQVLELMRDPLIHMLRNSADHGLEDGAGRMAAGKPETGYISLNAYHEGGNVVIEVSDDGMGLQTSRIRARALANGLVAEADLATMTEAQIQRFILRPGFSTAAVVSAISGRGVGMDVVKANIERIGGTIDLDSIPGRGTTFTIKIPLTLAIVSAFIVEARGERFALPQSCVVELVRVGETDSQSTAQRGPLVEVMDGVPMLLLRERLLPLVHLGDVLRLGEPAAGSRQAGSVIVVASVSNATIGIAVDRVFDTEEIVVKPVAPLLRHITMFGGTTILGDGSVIMILEPNGVARALKLAAAEQRARPTPAAVEDAERSGDLSAMLLFRAAPDATPSAVPLALVARIEDLPLDRIETSSGRPVTQYRGKLMPLVAVNPIRPEENGSAPVLVFSDRSRSMGLVVYEVVDVVEQRLVIELSAARPGLLGTAVIAGRVTDVIDAGYWLVQAWQDWFHHQPHQQASRKRMLVVEDSAFFRQLLVPMLAAAGFDVTAVESAMRALGLRDTAHAMFDIIISDVEMPEMGGLEFARHVRSGGIWRQTPLLALSGRVTEQDVALARAAGFTEYVAKLDRDILLAAVQRCLSPTRLEAA